jgi:hypothetical protein
MRKLFCFLLFVCLILADVLHAQSVYDSINSKPLLFESFLNGAVLMKSGQVERVPLNYNTDDQSIVFIKDGKYMVIDDLDNIDTVYLQHKKFVPVNNSMYQVVTDNGEVTLLVSYSNRIKPLVATTDHAGSSKKDISQVSNTVTDVYTNKLYRGNYLVEIKKSYWFKKNDKLYKVSSKKQFVNSFPSQARLVVEKYIADNKVNFAYEPDLVNLVAYCNEKLK